MTNLTPVNEKSNIYQLETTDRIMGGANGIANRQAQQLLNRIYYIENQMEARVPSGNKDGAGGVPVLGSDGKIKTSQLPANDYHRLVTERDLTNVLGVSWDRVFAILKNAGIEGEYERFGLGDYVTIPSFNVGGEMGEDFTDITFEIVGFDHYRNVLNTGHHVILASTTAFYSVGKGSTTYYSDSNLPGTADAVGDGIVYAINEALVAEGMTGDFALRTIKRIFDGVPFQTPLTESAFVPTMQEIRGCQPINPAVTSIGTSRQFPLFVMCPEKIGTDVKFWTATSDTDNSGYLGTILPDSEISSSSGSDNYCNIRLFIAV